MDRTAPAGAATYYVVTATKTATKTATAPAGIAPAGTESLPSAEVSPAFIHAWLRFDETSGTTSEDASGNKWDATLVNSPARVPGRLGNAVALSNENGQDEHIILPEGVASGLTDISITAWVYIDNQANWARIFDFGNGTTSYMFLTACDGGSRNPRFTINAGSGEQNVGGSKPLPTGQWAHIAFVLNKGTATLWLNGEEIGRNPSLTVTPKDLGKTTQNYLGKSQFPDAGLNGKIDDFRIYANALSPGEIAAIVKAGQKSP